MKNFGIFVLISIILMCIFITSTIVIYAKWYIPDRVASKNFVYGLCYVTKYFIKHNSDTPYYGYIKIYAIPGNITGFQFGPFTTRNETIGFLTTHYPINTPIQCYYNIEVPSYIKFEIPNLEVSKILCIFSFVLFLISIIIYSIIILRQTCDSEEDEEESIEIKPLIE